MNNPVELLACSLATLGATIAAAMLWYCWGLRREIARLTDELAEYENALVALVPEGVSTREENHADQPGSVPQLPGPAGGGERAGAAVPLPGASQGDHPAAAQPEQPDEVLRGYPVPHDTRPALA